MDQYVHAANKVVQNQKQFKVTHAHGSRGWRVVRARAFYFYFRPPPVSAVFSNAQLFPL